MSSSLSSSRVSALVGNNHNQFPNNHSNDKNDTTTTATTMMDLNEAPTATSTEYTSSSSSEASLEDNDKKIVASSSTIVTLSDLVVGAKIRRYFAATRLDNGLWSESGWYQGRIVQIKTPHDNHDDQNWYSVLYDDGDEEDMLEENALEAVQHYREHVQHKGMRPSQQNKVKIKLEDVKSEEVKSEPNVDTMDTQDDELHVRRSRRARTSTTITVGGHIIKKENNYLVKGLTYVHGVAQDEGPVASKTPHISRKTSTVPRKPRPVDPRVQVKARMTAVMEEKRTRRHAFLRQHLSLLKPFCENKVLDGLKTIPNDKALAMPKTEEYMQPELIHGDLRDYQLHGLNWMSHMHAHNVGMILGDEMGLGKTLQTISLVAQLKEQGQTHGPTLVICPLTVLYSWCDEIDKWTTHPQSSKNKSTKPGLSHLRFHNSNPDTLDLKSTAESLGQYDIVVTTYEMANSKALRHLWSRQAFTLLVLDEGHKIKSAETYIAQSVRRIHAENRIILTGTPVANNLVELWALLNFLVPDVFTTSKPFADAFDLSAKEVRVDPVKLTQANKMLDVFMLRRLKTEVEKLMPKKLETKIECPLSNTQIWWYKALLLKDQKLLEKISSGQEIHQSSKRALRNLVMQLRKCCVHPYLFEGVEDPEEEDNVEALIGASGKLAVLDKLLRKLYMNGHRVVLFSQFVTVLDILEDYAILRGWKYVRFDGSTLRAHRNHVVKCFNAPNSEKFLFLMSTRSGGMGLNLQTADTCVLFDSDWNPQPDIQAMARVHRIGQQKTVHVYRLITKGTVEERMVERAEKKLYLDRMVTQDGVSEEFKKDKEEEDDEENMGKILATLKFGCAAISGSQGNNLPSDSDIEQIVDRSRTEDFSSGNLKGGAEKTALDFDPNKGFNATTNFCGIDFLELREQKAKERDLSELAQIWKKKARDRKSRIKLVEGRGSGYGKTAVPVLASNNYDLQTGERSVFEQELKGRNVAGMKKSKGPTFESHQTFCQFCGDGGKLLCCPRCPVALHAKCFGVNRRNFLSCPHHRCTVCGKSLNDAGGFLYPCNACPNAYCEDHLPNGAHHLETNHRMEELGYTIKHGVYVLCSEICQNVAKQDFGWKPSESLLLSPRKRKATCPPKVDVTTNFGKEVDASLDGPGVEEVAAKRRCKNSKTYDEKPPAASFGSKPNVTRTLQGQEDSSPKNDKDHEQNGEEEETEKDEVEFVGSAGAPQAASVWQLSFYTVTLPVTPLGLGIRLGKVGNTSVFAGYAKLRDGSIGSAEANQVFRHTFDKLVEVDGQNCEQLSYEDICAMLSQKVAGRAGGFCVLKMQDQTSNAS